MYLITFYEVTKIQDTKRENTKAKLPNSQQKKNIKTYIMLQEQKLPCHNSQKQRNTHVKSI